MRLPKSFSSFRHNLLQTAASLKSNESLSVCLPVFFFCCCHLQISPVNYWDHLSLNCDILLASSRSTHPLLFFLILFTFLSPLQCPYGQTHISWMSKLCFCSKQVCYYLTAYGQHVTHQFFPETMVYFNYLVVTPEKQFEQFFLWVLVFLVWFILEREALSCSIQWKEGGFFMSGRSFVLSPNCSLCFQWRCFLNKQSCMEGLYSCGWLYYPCTDHHFKTKFHIASHHHHHVIRSMSHTTFCDELL